MTLDAIPGGLGYGNWKETAKQGGEFTQLRASFQCG